MESNLDTSTVRSFGDEWLYFDQLSLSPEEANRIFNDYFSFFPWDQLPPNPVGFDMGCGSGRWARLVAPLVGRLHCIDPSESLNRAREILVDIPNIEFHKSSVSNCGLAASSQDFGYSLGVLHHVPDTKAAIRSCVELLKPGAPLLLYLYYAFDNRPVWYRFLWQVTNIWRRFICCLPPRPKRVLTDFIAITVYYPLARFASFWEGMGFSVSTIPLSYYRNCSFYTMRTDARDRFGTPLEKRFTKSKIEEMCSDAGLVDIQFSPSAPFWCVIGFRSES